jgi:hypothetical protein
MKKLIGMLLVIALFFMGTSVWADTIALKAAWVANTDTATTGYKIYRTDGSRSLIGTIPGKTTSSYLFNITVPAGAIGTATFVLTATSATKESGDTAPASYPFDLTPVPPIPGGFGVTVQ